MLFQQTCVNDRLRRRTERPRTLCELGVRAPVEALLIQQTQPSTPAANCLPNVPNR